MLCTWVHIMHLPGNNICYKIDCFTAEIHFKHNLLEQLLQSEHLWEVMSAVYDMYATNNFKIKLYLLDPS